ncbi:hypothetical protein Hanom_Chr12g01105261 [Helianthus anomalus]
MPSSYPGRHIKLPRLEPSTSGKRWVSVANWTTPVGLFKCICIYWAINVKKGPLHYFIITY